MADVATIEAVLVRFWRRQGRNAKRQLGDQRYAGDLLLRSAGDVNLTKLAEFLAVELSADGHG